MSGALRLIVEGREPVEVVAYACPKCGTVYGQHGSTVGDLAHESTERIAAGCCEKKCACGAPTRKFWTVCDACRAKEDAAKAQARYDKAEKVRESDERVVALHCPCHDDRFYDESWDLFEAHFSDGDELPDYAWACEKRGLKFDASRIVDRAIEDGDHHEDAEADPEAVKDLQAHLDAFAAACGVESIFPTNLVVLLAEEKAEYLKECS